MCLAVPMRIRELRSNAMGLVDLDGSQYEADLSLVDVPQVGDYVIVHAGYAIEKLDEQEADIRLALFRQLAAAEEATSSTAGTDAGKGASRKP